MEDEIDEPPGGVPIRTITDIVAIPAEEFMHLKLCKRDPTTGARKLEDHFVMTHDDFWRCFRDKVEKFGGK